MSSFKDMFGEVETSFSDDCPWAIAADGLTRQEAAQKFLEAFKNEHSEEEVAYLGEGKIISENDVDDDWVRWCCQWDYDDECGRAAWWFGVTPNKRGAKRVWTWGGVHQLDYSLYEARREGKIKN